jgi:anti-sigma factor RsiW
MDCKEMHVLSSYLDHELDLVRSLEAERHLKNCEICTQNYKAQRTLRNLMAESSLYLRAPLALQDRVCANMGPMDAKRQKSFTIRWQWLATAASFAFVFLLGWIMGHSQLSPSSDVSAKQEIVSNHVRSLLPGHLTDVLSSDQHTVKPWFSGKLDFSPPVKDLASQGFPLLGGRIDYVNHKTVAVLIYRHNQHIINLFLSYSPGKTNKEPVVATLQGYNIIQWIDSEVVYHAVSDLDKTELGDFCLSFERSDLCTTPIPSTQLIQDAVMRNDFPDQ